MGRVTCYVKTRKQEKQLLLIKNKTEKTKLNDLTLFKVSNIIDDKKFWKNVKVIFRNSVRKSKNISLLKWSLLLQNLLTLLLNTL